MSFNPNTTIVLRQGSLSSWVNTSNSDVAERPIMKLGANPALRREKSFESFHKCTLLQEQTNPLESMTGTIENLPTRIWIGKHVVGFRSYCRMREMEAEADYMVQNLKFFLSQDFLGLQFAIEGAEEALNSLQEAENQFYAAADQIQKYEHRIVELDFLKANVERCITSSIAKVKQDLESVQQEARSVNPVMQTLDEMVNQPWRDHNQLRIHVDALKSCVLSSNRLTELFPDLKIPNTSMVYQAIDSLEQYVRELKQESKMQRLFTANYSIELFELKLNVLKDFNTQYTTALSMNQAIASVMLTFSLEARATQTILYQRTAKINLEYSLMPRNIDEEERELIDFIYNGRACHMKIKPKPEPCRLFNKSDQNSPPPVWAQAWSPKTRLLQSKV